MELQSINIGKATAIENAKSVGKTGIFKQPVAGAVEITTDGLPGDTICDVEHHGGVDQAIYLYGTADYAWWSAELGSELAPGAFGENLTVSGLESMGYNIGDRFHIGTVILEVTAPRIPCVTLAARMGDPTFVKRFRDAERPGLYCRVIRPGIVQSGDAVNAEAYTGPTISVREMFRSFYEPVTDAKTLRRHLAAPIAIRARIDKEEILDQITAA